MEHVTGGHEEGRACGPTQPSRSGSVSLARSRFCPLNDDVILGGRKQKWLQQLWAPFLRTAVSRGRERPPSPCRSPRGGDVSGPPRSPLVQHRPKLQTHPGPVQAQRKALRHPTLRSLTKSWRGWRRGNRLDQFQQPVPASRAEVQPPTTTALLLHGDGVAERTLNDRPHAPPPR